LKKQNYSKAHEKYLKGLKVKAISIHSARILLLILLFGVWELLANSGIVDPFITSSPSRVIKQLGILIRDGSLFYHSFVTLYETVLAFVISTLVGTLVAILLFAIPPVRKVLEPYLIVLNSLPKIALGPLIIVWMGTGTKSIVAMGFLICIVITTISVIIANSSANQGKVTGLSLNTLSFMYLIFELVLSSSLMWFDVGFTWSFVPQVICFLLFLMLYIPSLYNLFNVKKHDNKME